MPSSPHRRACWCPVACTPNGCCTANASTPGSAANRQCKFIHVYELCVISTVKTLLYLLQYGVQELTATYLQSLEAVLVDQYIKATNSVSRCAQMLDGMVTMTQDMGLEPDSPQRRKLPLLHRVSSFPNGYK